MKKNKKEIIKAETIDKYISTGNPHYDEYATAFHIEVIANDLFSEIVEIPLRLFSSYTVIFFNQRGKPSQVLEQFSEDLNSEKLSIKQQVFIVRHLIQYLKKTKYVTDVSNKYDIGKQLPNNIFDKNHKHYSETIELNPIVRLLKVKLEKLFQSMESEYKSTKILTTDEILDDYYYEDSPHYNNYVSDFFDELQESTIFNDVNKPLQVFDLFINNFNDNKDNPKLILKELVNNFHEFGFTDDQKGLILSNSRY
jgi:hypothetical protein